VESDHAERIIEFALDAQNFVREYTETHSRFEIDFRFGVCSGPASAISIPNSVPKWYLIGSSLGLVKLMYENSKPMRIHISESTKNLLEPTNKYRIRKDVLRNKVAHQNLNLVGGCRYTCLLGQWQERRTV
jgi:hypothetical protein